MKYTLTFEADTVADLHTQLINELESLTSTSSVARPCRSIPALVEDLELTVRSQNCLREEGIVYVSTLVKWSAQELAEIPRMGVKSVREIAEVLASYELLLSTHTEIRRPLRDTQ